MGEGRALLTDREREALADEEATNYRYKTRTYFRRRLDKLADDVEHLAEHDPQLLEELREVVCPGAGGATPQAVDDVQEGDGRGAVQERREATPAPDTGDVSDAVAAVEAAAGDPDTDALPGGVDVQEAAGVVDAVREYLREEGPASMREIVLDVMPSHPLGYSPPDELAPGDRYRGAWWRRVVRPALVRLDDVEYRNGHGDYRYVGDGGV